MGLKGWFVRLRETAAENRRLRERGGTGQAECEAMVRSVLETFLRSDFPDGNILKTASEEWEVRHLTEKGETVTDLKVQLHLHEGRPRSFVCAYYRPNGVHMRQSNVRRDALIKAIRHCVAS
jgi:hypothetical protein